jgi:hypothetical protein
MNFMERIDPDAAARKLLEIANAIEPAQDGRIYIELVNAAFVNTPPPKGGGFELRLKAGLVGPMGRLVQF